MADMQTQQPNIEQARALLSPYLDGEVTAQERALVETAIAASPELRQDLETLRQTVSLLAALPPVAAPRPFTLSEADVRPVRPAAKPFLGLPRWLMGWATLAATLLCVLAIGGVFLAGQFGGMTAQPAQIAYQQEAAAPAAEAVEEAPAEAEMAKEAAPAEPPAEEKMAAAEAPVEEPAATAEAPLAQKVAPAADEEMAEAETEAEEPAPPAALSVEIPEETAAEESGQAAEEAAEDTVTMAAAPPAEEGQDRAEVGAAAEAGAEAPASPLPTPAPAVAENTQPAEAPAPAPETESAAGEAVQPTATVTPLPLPTAQARVTAQPLPTPPAPAQPAAAEPQSVSLRAILPFVVAGVVALALAAGVVIWLVTKQKQR